MQKNPDINDIKSYVFDFIIHEVSKLHRLKMCDVLSSWLLTNNDQKEVIADFALQIWQKNQLVEASVHYLTVLSVIHDFVLGKYLPSVIKSLTIINGKERIHQYIYSCKKVASFLTMEDIIKANQVELFAVVLFINQKSPESINAFAKVLSAAISNISYSNKPSFKLLKNVSGIIPSELYIQQILPQMERLFLRNGAKLFPTFCRILPKIQLPVNDKSIIHNLVSAILTETPENKKSLIPLFEKCYSSYNQNELFSSLLSFYSKARSADQKIVLGQFFQCFKTSAISEQLYRSFIDLVKSEKSPDALIVLVPFFESQMELSIDFLLSNQFPDAVLPTVFNVLSNANDKQSQIIQYSQANFKQSPQAAAITLLVHGVNLSQEMINMAIGPCKIPSLKLEVLIRLGMKQQFAEQFAIGSSQYITYLLNRDIKLVQMFLEGAIESPTISDKILYQFSEFVRKNCSKINNRLIIALLCSSLAKESDVKLLIEVIQIRKNMAISSLCTIGFTQEQYEYINTILCEYVRSPLPKEDVHLFLCNDIDPNHPTAQLYNSIKEEIAHPTSQSNLPQLRKNLEKSGLKLLDKQNELRSQFGPKIEVLKISIELILQQCKKSKIIPDIFGLFIPNLFILHEVEIVKEFIDNIFLTILRRSSSYQDSASLILNEIFEESTSINDSIMSIIVPKSINSLIIHLLFRRLPILLSSDDTAPFFASTSAISHNMSLHLLLPLFIEHSNVHKSVYNFAISMCQNHSFEELSFIEQYLLFPIETIRNCALECLSSSIVTPPISPNLLSMIIVHSVSNPIAVDLLEKIDQELPDINTAISIFTKFFLIENKDENLIKDIGVSFGTIESINNEPVIEFLIQLYSNNIPNPTNLTGNDYQNSIRLSISYAFLELKSQDPKCISFVSNVAVCDPNPLVRQNIMSLIEFYIQSTNNSQRNELFSMFFTNLEKVSTEVSHHLRIASLLICSKLCKGKKDESLRLMRIINDSILLIDNDETRLVAAQVQSQIIREYSKETDRIYSEILNLWPSIKDMGKLIAFAYSYSSFVYSLRLTGFSTRNVFDFALSLASSEVGKDRFLCAYIIFVLSQLYKKVFEIFLPNLLPILIPMTDDNNNDVRIQSEKAIQSILGYLTHGCGERVLPSALNSYNEDGNYRLQIASLTFIEKVLRISSKGVSKYVPQIVSTLGKALKCPNNTVKAAASSIMELLRSLITNESVLSCFSILVSAVTNPSNLEVAIDTISKLNISTFLDSSSMSLIVPIVAYGCRSTNQNCKSQAIQLVGHLPAIASEGCLLPFSDELIEPLLSCISDSAPNIRAISTKSLSNIIKALPISIYNSIMERLLSSMSQEISFAGTQGISMAIALLIKTQGVEELKEKINDFVYKASNNSDLKVREGYVSLLGYLPFYFGSEDFSDCYDLTVNAVLDACADQSDSIRTVGLRSASLISKTFAISKPDLILTAYFSCAQRENWRHRLCSISFIKSFIMVVSGTTEADDKGARQIGAILDSLTATIPKQLLLPALMTLFILTNDPVSAVSNEAHNAWRSIIPNTGAYLREYIDELLDRIESFLSSEFEVVRTVGAYALKEGVRKLKTIFINSSLKLIHKMLEMDDIDIQHGGIMSIHALVDDINQDFKYRCCTLIAPFLSSPHELLRNEATKAFYEMKDTLDEKGFNVIADGLVKFIYESAAGPDDITQLGGLLSILGTHSMLALSHDILRRPLDENRPRIAGKIIKAAASSLEPIMANFSERLITICAHPTTEEEGKLALLITQSIADNLDDNHLRNFSSKLVENMRSQKPQNRLASITLANHILKTIGGTFSDIMKNLVKAALYMFDDPLDDVMTMATQTIKTVGEVIRIEDVPHLIMVEREGFESICTTSKVRSFSIPSTFEALECLIEKSFSSSIDAIRDASILLSTVVPQLTYSPSSTRKYLALIIRSFQSRNSPIFAQLLSASRVLFEKATSEWQMLVFSLPSSYLRLYKEPSASLHNMTTEALCSLASRVSSPSMILKYLLHVVRHQKSEASPILLNGIIKILKGNAIPMEDARQCIRIVSPLLTSNNKGMKELSAQTIASTLLSIPIEELSPVLESLICMNTESAFTSVVILNELLSAQSKQINEIILPIVKNCLQIAKSLNDPDVTMQLPKIVITTILADYSLIQELLQIVIDLIIEGEPESQVLALQEIQRLSVIKPAQWKEQRQELFTTLVSAYQFGSAAVISASGSALFEIFKLEEKSTVELETFAKAVGDESLVQVFADIINQKQTDRANQRVLR